MFSLWRGLAYSQSILALSQSFSVINELSKDPIIPKQNKQLDAKIVSISSLILSLAARTEGVCWLLCDWETEFSNCCLRLVSLRFSSDDKLLMICFSTHSVWNLCPQGKTINDFKSRISSQEEQFSFGDIRIDFDFSILRSSRTRSAFWMLSSRSLCSSWIWSL